MKINDNKKMIIYACVLAIGVVIVVAACLGYVDDFWSGFGGGLTGVAIVRLVLGIRYRKDSEYARKIDIANNDERTLYVSGKAKSWAFYISILIFAVSGSVLLIIGQQAYGKILLLAVCVMTLIYWASYNILNRKY